MLGRIARKFRAAPQVLEQMELPLGVKSTPVKAVAEEAPRRGLASNGVLQGLGFDAIGEAVYAPMNFMARSGVGQTGAQAALGTTASAAGSLAGSFIGGRIGRGVSNKFFGGKYSHGLEIGGSIAGSMAGAPIVEGLADKMTGAQWGQSQAQAAADIIQEETSPEQPYTQAFMRNIYGINQ